MSYSNIESISKDLKLFSKELKKAAKSGQRELLDLEFERDALIDLLMEVRCYCYSSKPRNRAILKLISDTVKDRLNYDDPAWEQEYFQYDAEGNEFPCEIAGSESFFDDEEEP